MTPRSIFPKLASWRRLSGVHRLTVLCAVVLSLGFGACRSSVAADGTVPGVRLEDLEGKLQDPFSLTNAKALVFVFVSTDCPISNAYAPEIQRLARQFAARGVSFRLIYPCADETPAMVKQHLKEHGYAIDALRDTRHLLVKVTGVHVIPEVGVYVPGRGFVYRGRIDNRFAGFGKARSEATQHDLRDSLTALLEGKPIASPVTTAIGCYISE